MRVQRQRHTKGASSSNPVRLIRFVSPEAIEATESLLKANMLIDFSFRPVLSLAAAKDSRQATQHLHFLTDEEAPVSC